MSEAQPETVSGREMLRDFEYGDAAALADILAILSELYHWADDVSNGSRPMTNRELDMLARIDAYLAASPLRDPEQRDGLALSTGQPERPPQRPDLRPS